MIEIVLINHEHGIDCGERAEEQDGADEGVPVAVLQRIVKSVVPLVEHHGDGDDRQFDGDHRASRMRPGQRSSERKYGMPTARSWRASQQDLSRKTSDVDEFEAQYEAVTSVRHYTINPTGRLNDVTQRKESDQKGLMVHRTNTKLSTAQCVLWRGSPYSVAIGNEFA